jgi:hypothetical protein
MASIEHPRPGLKVDHGVTEEVGDVARCHLMLSASPGGLSSQLRRHAGEHVISIEYR